MASFHPGVKSLIDRVLKQQPKNEKKNIDSNELDEPRDIQTDKKLINQKLSHNCANKYATFKSLLKDRMKEKRRLLREEEEEEDKLNEEYHVVKEVDEGTKSTDDGDKENVEEEDDEECNDDDDEEGDEEEDSDGDKSSDDFKLNLDDDDDEDKEDNEKTKFKKTKTKTTKSSDDEDELFNCDDILNYKENKNEIPASIPSNQLTSNSSITIKPCKLREYDFESFDDDMTTQRQFRLYIDSSDQQKQKEDDIESISLNFDNINNSLNRDTNDLSLNTTATTKLNLSENNNNVENDAQGFEEFDELAMLCSGNFKSSENKKISFGELKTIFKEKDNEELQNESNHEKNEVENSKTLEDEQTKFKENINDDEEDFCILNVKKNDEKKSKLVFDEDDDEESKNSNEKEKNEELIEDEVEEDSNEKIINEADDLYQLDDESDDVKEKPSRRLFGIFEENEDDNGNIKDARKAFFENEAELSGDEMDSDENFEGDSNDEELVCSGDEDQVGSDGELKSELANIYLKDQINEDKRKVRMLKERYLKDGELHQDKGFRKKQFRWKNLDNRFGNTQYSSDEDDDDEDVEEDGVGLEEDKTLRYENSKLFQKSPNNSNWRKNRHEREQFVNSKRGRADDLLSSDEEKTNDSIENTESSQKGLIFKIGQNLLKSKTTTKNNTSEEMTNVQSVVCQANTLTTSASPSSTQQKSKKFLEKFSFLKKDQSYLNRISSYVNKTLNLTSGTNSVKSSSTKTVNNMIFSRLSQMPVEEKNIEEKNNSDEDVTLKAVKCVQEPVAKKPKLDKSSSIAESVFNHL